MGDDLLASVRDAMPGSCSLLTCLCGDNGEGERGVWAFGELAVTNLYATGLLEGERESERRSWIRVEVASKRWQWVGDGRCSVPPSWLGEYERTMLGITAIAAAMTGVCRDLVAVSRSW